MSAQPFAVHPVVISRNFLYAECIKLTSLFVLPALDFKWVSLRVGGVDAIDIHPQAVSNDVEFGHSTLLRTCGNSFSFASSPWLSQQFFWLHRVLELTFLSLSQLAWWLQHGSLGVGWPFYSVSAALASAVSDSAVLASAQFQILQGEHMWWRPRCWPDCVTLCWQDGLC